jgi:pyrroline-5-carboxylate reductase
VAAGVTTAAMEKVLPEDVGVVRAMPNTPAIVGRAITGISAGSRATEWAVETSVQLFETVGKTIVLDESKIDALSTISGSGPAYVFFLIEHLTNAARHQGFSDEEAALLVNETFLGAAELLVYSEKSPEVLRKQVTSPNGTTERAIARMSETDLQNMFIEATDAALARAKELAAGK